MHCFSNVDTISTHLNEMFGTYIVNKTKKPHQKHTVQKPFLNHVVTAVFTVATQLLTHFEAI